MTTRGKAIPTETRDGFPASPESFDVTCVIGTVDFRETGEFSPHEAAFLLIARHDTRGTFKFPMWDGREMSVTVDYPDSAETRPTHNDWPDA